MKHERTLVLLSAILFMLLILAGNIFPTEGAADKDMEATIPLPPSEAASPLPPIEFTAPLPASEGTFFIQ
ncbi:MAG: hypothetical protein AABZ07_03405, partial [Nitrospirota bacterium]